MKRSGLKTVSVKVPGKLMILGEHAVVYGYSCISSAVNKFLTVKMKESGVDSISTPGITDQRYVKMIVNDLKEQFQTSVNLSVRIDSGLTGLGLGSSSAVTVGLVKCFHNLFNLSLGNEELFNLSLKYLRKFQPLASGYDIGTVIYGGTVLYHGNSQKTEKLSEDNLPLLVAFSGKKAFTPDLVNNVAILKKKSPRTVEEIFRSIDGIVRDGVSAVREGNWPSLGRLMDRNHLLLSGLGVSTPKIEKLVTAARNAGAYGAKLSGAGGGDCVIVLYPDAGRKDIIKALEKEGGIIII